MNTNVKIGDKVRITDGFKNNSKTGTVRDFSDNVIWVVGDDIDTPYPDIGDVVANLDWCFEIIISNRQHLNDFIKKNHINKSKVSVMLGKSRNWLDTLASNSELKRRGDISECKLNWIMKQLVVDWTSNSVMHVNTKGFVPYITRPCTYHTDMHKARLQRAYWDGEVAL